MGAKGNSERAIFQLKPLEVKLQKETFLIGSRARSWGKKCVKADVGCLYRKVERLGVI